MLFIEVGSVVVNAMSVGSRGFSSGLNRAKSCAVGRVAGYRGVCTERRKAREKKARVRVGQAQRRAQWATGSYPQHARTRRTAARWTHHCLAWMGSCKIYFVYFTCRFNGDSAPTYVTAERTLTTDLSWMPTREGVRERMCRHLHRPRCSNSLSRHSAKLMCLPWPNPTTPPLHHASTL